MKRARLAGISWNSGPAEAGSRKECDHDFDDDDGADGHGDAGHGDDGHHLAGHGQPRHDAGQRDEAAEHIRASAAIFADVGSPDELHPEIWKLVEW